MKPNILYIDDYSDDYLRRKGKIILKGFRIIVFFAIIVESLPFIMAFVMSTLKEKEAKYLVYRVFYTQPIKIFLLTMALITVNNVYLLRNVDSNVYGINLIKHFSSNKFMGLWILFCYVNIILIVPISFLINTVSLLIKEELILIDFIILIGLEIILLLEFRFSLFFIFKIGVIRNIKISIQKKSDLLKRRRLINE